jgi:opacity protein-like surface antigen
MMGYRLPALLGVAAFAVTTSVQAADMPQLPLPALKAPVQEFFSPWYVRIDGGYRINKIDGGRQLGVAYTDSNIVDAGTIGGGVGYKWNWLRTDITFDYGAQPKFEGFIGAPLAPTTTARIASFTTLWNGYVDMGTWWGFTPYFGGGVGFSYLKPAGFQLNPPTPFAVVNEGRWQFSWAATGGASYAISPALLFDLNYRYLDLGQARTNITSIGEVTYGDWTAHEFRVGIRYLIQ